MTAIFGWRASPAADPFSKSTYQFKEGWPCPSSCQSKPEKYLIAVVTRQLKSKSELLKVVSAGRLSPRELRRGLMKPTSCATVIQNDMEAKAFAAQLTTS